MQDVHHISELVQKLHDLVHCQAPNPTWDNGRSRAEMYFLMKPTPIDKINLLADETAKELAVILSHLSPQDWGYESCVYALEHCYYDLHGNRIK